MKISKVIFPMLLFVIMISACSANHNELINNAEFNKRMHDQLIDKSTNGVDIWNSINYEIITDSDTIKNIEATANDGAVLINLVVSLENKGNSKADSFKFTFETAAPLNHISASEHQGIDKGFLGKDDKYEFHCLYIFRNREDLNNFIEQSTIKIEWKEELNNNETNQKLLKIPM